ncbi:AI-2E family transporter [Aggregatimonas sangjinii]|uniref:AI-2E family transporter n=1 Tax=Aggregatimonas sangjinii TaxID=2583587 RepID=A0A5B7SLN8_9FLAO|nr:AI-2E family transporter [Aggregatimonas sangjinii]QCW99495.1 AI-2E family transporter [Aggregatimonas sangjinii]
MAAKEEKVTVSEAKFHKRILSSIGLVSAAILLILFVLFGFRIILLVLAGILVAAFFLGIAGFIENKTPLSRNISLLVSVLLVVGILVGSSFLLAPHISEQIVSLKEKLPQATEKTLQDIEQTKLGGLIVQRIENIELGANKGQIAKFFGSLFGTFSTLYIIFFLGMFFMIAPMTYVNGLIKLFPKARRERTEEILLAMGKTLKSWLLGKLLSMLIVGILTGIGLSILGVPLALTLAIFAALISFIPNFGPLIALVPAFLLAFTESPTTALYVAMLYLGVQAIESNVLTPMIQKKMISLPMAMVLIAQIALGLFTGLLGVILAVPLVAAIIVLVKMAYIEDILGDTSIDVKYEDSSNE